MEVEGLGVLGACDHISLLLKYLKIKLHYLFGVHMCGHRHTSAGMWSPEDDLEDTWRRALLRVEISLCY